MHYADPFSEPEGCRRRSWRPIYGHLLDPSACADVYNQISERLELRMDSMVSTVRLTSQAQAVTALVPVEQRACCTWLAAGSI